MKKKKCAEESKLSGVALCENKISYSRVRFELSVILAFAERCQNPCLEHTVSRFCIQIHLQRNILLL